MELLRNSLDYLTAFSTALGCFSLLAFFVLNGSIESKKIKFLGTIGLYLVVFSACSFISVVFIF